MLFNPVSGLGMPWHGLATEGKLTTAVNGDKTVEGGNGPGYPGEGTCVLVRHPAAPGSAVRTPGQQASDTVRGLEWRDYLLLCGPDRHINGGPALGANAWIYIDTSGVPWRMTIETAVAGSVVTVTVWRRELFGRFGRQYTIADEQVASFDWSPQMPSWYTGGTTATTIAGDAVFDDVIAMVPDSTGANLIINVYAGSQDAANVFPETKFGGNVLLSILEINVGGAGDLGNTGIGISATIAEVAQFETNLVTARTAINAPSATGPSWEVNCTNPTYPPTEPTSGQADTNATFTLQHSTSFGGLTAGALEEYAHRIETESAAIIYRTHRGDITRSDRAISHAGWFHGSPSGTRTADITFEAYWEDPPEAPPTPRWRFLTCGPVTGQITHTIQYRTYDEQTITINAFGHSEQVSVIRDDRDNTIREYWDGCLTTCLGSATESDETLPDAWFSYTCNGESYLPGFGGLDPECGIAVFAPNLFALWSDFTLPDNLNRRLSQRWVGDGESSAAQLWSDTTSWLLADYQALFESPLHRRASFQPVTMEFAHGQTNVAANRFQYC